MKLVFEIRRHGEEEDARHCVFTSFPVTIGRAYDNDIILNDLYASAHHLRVEHDGETCSVADAGSENGFTLNGEPPPGSRTAIASDDVIRIGMTEIRIYRPDHPVPPALPLSRDGAFFEWIGRPLSVWGCFLLAIALTLCWAWLEIWSDEVKVALAAAAGGVAIAALLWAALWSAGGRLARHNAHFKGHLALASLYMIASTLAWYIEAYIDFLANGWFSKAVTYSINFVLLGFLLYGSFALATKMPRRARAVSAGAFSLGIVAGVFILGLVSAKNFNPQPDYSATLEPYLSQFAPAHTPDAFMAGNEKLFSLKEFKGKKAGER
jgi:hypothetical protein